MLEVVACVFLIVVVAVLAKVSSGQKSDELSHKFLINRIEPNLLHQPCPGGLINETSWGGYPVGWHYLAKRITTKRSAFVLYRFFVEYQPQIFLLLTLGICVAFTNLIMFEVSLFCTIFSALIVITNYFNTDIINSKNVGFSSRSVGVLLSVLFLQSANPETPVYVGIALCFFSALASLFINLFATQLIVMYSALTAIATGNILPIIAVFLSILLFLIIGGTYARGYFFSTLKYLYVYNSQLIFIFGFKSYRNFHLYFVSEFFTAARKRDGRRMYFLCTRNPLLVGVYSIAPFIYLVLTDTLVVNEFLWLAPLGVIWVATSFGRARSLGEGHRYLEPIVYVSAAHVAQAVEFGDFSAAAVISLYGALNLATNIWAKKQASSIDSYYSLADIESLKSKLAKISLQENVRVGFDTHYLGRYFLLEDYGVALPFSPELDYAGFRPGAVYSQYPFFSDELVIAQIKFYSLTHLLCDDTREEILAKNSATKIASFGNLGLWATREEP